jgi:hypothetical protein
MNKYLLSLTTLATLSNLSVSARELMCEQCEPEPCCWEHLFVERSQFFVHGEFLYWSVEEGTLDYAIRANKPLTEDQQINSVFAFGDYKRAEYDWKPGFRIALAYYNCAKYWEVTAQYTQLDCSGKNSVKAPANEDQILAPTRDIYSFGGDVLKFANTSLDFDYKLGDLYVARVFDPNPHLRLRLFGGFTGGHLEQTLDIHYASVVEQGEETFNLFDKVKEKWDFSGGGFRIGLTSDWYWCGNFYLTGRASFATLIGKYCNHEFQSENFEGDPVDIVADTKYDDIRFAFHNQFLLGPSWQIPCECWSFELFAGWEFNLWFNLHERIRTNRGRHTDAKETYYARSLVGMQGFTLRATLGF